MELTRAPRKKKYSTLGVKVLVSGEVLANFKDRDSKFSPANNFSEHFRTLSNYERVKEVIPAVFACER